MTTFTNNARGTLAGSIAANTTTITLGSGQGSLFPESEFPVTLKQRQAGVIILQEIAWVTNRSGDVLTIVRAYEACPRTETSTDQEQTAYSFDLYVDEDNGTVIEHTLTANSVNDIKDDIEDLTETKLNKGGLRTLLATAWKIFFSNGSKNETELALGANNTYLRSNGPEQAPTRGNPPLDIEAQNEVTAPTTSWFAVLFNGTENVKTTLSNFVKGLPYASTSKASVVERLTDTEFNTGSDTTRYPSTKQIHDKFGYSIVSGDGLVVAADSPKAAYNNTIIKAKEVTIAKAGTYKLVWEGHGDDNDNDPGYSYVYVNGVDVSGSLYMGYSNNTWYDFEYDVAVSAGDKIQLYVQGYSSNGSAVVRNFRVKAASLPNSVTAVVDLD